MPMLNWIQVVWLAVTCIATILGVFHLLVWTRQRDQTQHAIVAAISFAVACSAVLGVNEFIASTPSAYAESLRWSHTMASIVTVLVVAFVQSTAPGRLRLGLAVCAVRIAVEIANRTTGVSVSFLTIDELRPILSWGGVSFMSPLGQANPWYALAQLANLLLLVYLVDVLIKLARQPRSEQRRRNLQLVSALLFFLVFSGGAMSLVVAFQAPVPASLPLAFLGFVLVMNHHIVGDLLRSAELARALKLSESTLERFDGDLQLAERAVGLGLWRWDAATRQVWFSDRSARLFGYERGGLYDQEAVFARIDAEDLARVRAADPAAADGSGEFSGEFRIVRAADGERRWLAAHALRVHEPATGKLVQAHGVVIDLTDHRALGEVFRLVFEATPDAMLLVGAKGGIALANQAAAELSGYAVSELRGMSIDALVPADARADHAALRNDYIAAATRRQMRSSREVHLRRRDGDDRIVEVKLHPIQVDSKPMVIVAIDDISMRQSREREQAMQRAALAHVARVGMLAELSGSLAHEINQPLAAILSNAQAARRFIGHTPPNLDEVRDGLTAVVDSAKRAGEVIRRLRAMLRNEAPDFAALDINQTIREVMQILHSDLINRQMQIVEAFADGLPLVHGDRVQLQQVILNLVVNAADAMAGTDGECRITLSTQCVAGGVLVEVADVGTGIAQEELSRIFQTFVTTKADGLGFGLPLCMSLVQAHGGKLWATNNLGAGATFHVLLPTAG